MIIKSFRGLIADGVQDTIVLHTNSGGTGYRISKFDVMPTIIAEGADTEHIVMIWKVERTDTELGDTTTTRPNFSNQVLLGTAILIQDVAGSGHGYWPSVIFDNEIFNQDIYVTHRDVSGTGVACNYYIELEQMNLDLTQNTVATLKDIRNITT